MSNPVSTQPFFDPAYDKIYKARCYDFFPKHYNQFLDIPSWSFPESIRAKILNDEDSDWRDLGYFSDPDAMVEEHDNEHDREHDNKHNVEHNVESDKNKTLEKETLENENKNESAIPSNSDTDDRDKIRRIDMENGIQMELDNHSDYIPYTFVIKEPAQASACCEIHPYIKCPCKNVKKASCATVNCKFKYSKNMFINEAMLKDGLEIMDIPSTLLETIDKRAMDNERKKRKQQEKRREMLNQNATASATASANSTSGSSTSSTSENGQNMPQNIVHANIPLFNPALNPQFHPHFNLAFNPQITVNPFNLPFNGQLNQLNQLNQLDQHVNRNFNQPGNLLPIHAYNADNTAEDANNVTEVTTAATNMATNTTDNMADNNQQAMATVNDRMTANFLGTLNMLAANMEHRIPAEKIEEIINRHHMQDTLMMGDPPGDTTDMLVDRTEHAADMSNIGQLESMPEDTAHDMDEDSADSDGDNMAGYMDVSITENLNKLNDIGEDSPKRKMN